ncbi:MAG: MotA/TolQ/ExbB proton channel family protein [Desulfobacteraceae bacterium]|jgi:biopolymer transport protein ExbB/TolQ
MNILNLMQGTLYLIMNALLYPVIAAIIILVFCILFSLGGFVSELIIRRRNSGTYKDAQIEELAADIARDTLSGIVTDNMKNNSIKNNFIKKFLDDLLVQASKGVQGLDIRVEKLITAHEGRSRKTLDKTRLMIRIGPMLGLMGTLIPMGPALLSLSKGDLTQMANCLVIAFGTTVSGLAVGVLAYVVSVMREQWYAKDRDEMEYLADLVLDNIEGAGEVEENNEGQKLKVLPVSRGGKQ